MGVLGVQLGMDGSETPIVDAKGANQPDRLFEPVGTMEGQQALDTDGGSDETSPE